VRGGARVGSYKSRATSFELRAASCDSVSLCSGGTELRSAAGIPIVEACKTTLFFLEDMSYMLWFFAAGQVGHFLKKDNRLFFSLGGLIFVLSFVPH
jgi:hypothetical protein